MSSEHDKTSCRIDSFTAENNNFCLILVQGELCLISSVKCMNTLGFQESVFVMCNFSTESKGSKDQIVQAAIYNCDHKLQPSNPCRLVGLASPFRVRSAVRLFLVSSRCWQYLQCRGQHHTCFQQTNLPEAGMTNLLPM